MGAALREAPFFVVLMAIGAAAMLIPAAHALTLDDHRTARAFLYGAILMLGLTLLVALAVAGRRQRQRERGQLVTLLAAYTVLPAFFAVPFHEAAPASVSFAQAWFEMVSSATTTGATLFDQPRFLASSLHLWRALVGWMGGLLIWVAAVAVLAPLNIGGFEVHQAVRHRGAGIRLSQIARIADPSERLRRYAGALAPLYLALTGVLWLGLTIAGEVPFVALCHAMAILSTSGISPVGGIAYSGAGFAGELMIVLFLLLALSRMTYSARLHSQTSRNLRRDPELRVGLFFIVALPAALFLRHWVLAEDGSFAQGFVAGLEALWGGVFMVVSFLTTTGFESAYWMSASAWSGLSTPGLFLVGLSVIGGGVATTAGGVKLLRVYALFKHGEREVERLVYPSSVGGAGAEARAIRRSGAQIAWIFFMLFAMSIAAVMVLLSLTGVQFETAMVLGTAALTTNGPLAQIAAEAPISYAGLSGWSHLILGAAMVLGRLETLALIALLNPGFWRR
ncbi:MAG: trk system potassium uptake protein TrkH [Rhodobacteraceae bacterium HLUCCA08]|nr:MAG: trk system potassium uptake protein TrkH [Rhodobacteraceae bacterium HLUCCA08]